MPFPFDPATYYDEEMQRLTGGGPGPKFPAYRPEEEEGVLRYLGRKVLGGVGFIGNVLDTPGSVVRGLLAGDPGRAFEGVLDPGKRVHGRELLESAGVLDSNTEGLDWGDVAGFGADVLTDPLTYLHFGAGALTNTGKAAQKSQQLAKTFGERVAQGQQTLARVRLPFFPEAGFNVGGKEALDALGSVGSGVAKAASYVPGASTVGKAANAVGEAVAPIGRSLGAMFDKAYEGTTSKYLQPVMKNMNQNVLPGKLIDYAKGVEDVAHELATAGGWSPTASREIVDMMEGILPIGNTPTGVVAGKLKQMMAALPPEERDLGLVSHVIDNFAPRSMTPLERGTQFAGGKGASPVDPFQSSMLGREHDLYGDMPTSYINDLIAGRLGDYRGMNDLQRAAWARQKLYDWEARRGGLGRQGTIAAGGEQQAKALRKMAGKGKLKELTEAETKDWVRLGERAAGNGPPLGPVEQAAYNTLNQRVQDLHQLERHNAILKQSTKFGDWAGSLRPEYVDQGLDFFGGNIFQDVKNRLTSSAKATSKADALYGLFQQPGILGRAGPDTVPLQEAFGNLINKGHFDPKAHEVLMNRLGMTAKEYAAAHVPKELADDLVRATAGYVIPEAVQPIVKAVDSLQNLFKSTVSSSLLPTNLPRFSRNMTSQIWDMTVAGAHDPRHGAWNPLGYVAPIQDAMEAFRKGGVVKGASEIPAFAGMTDEQATKEIVKWAAAGDILGHGKVTFDAATTLPGAEHLAQQTLRVPGEAQPTLGQIFKGAVPKSVEEAKPWNIAGFNNRNVSQFAPAKAGKELDAFMDDLTKGGTLIALLRQGFDPKAAIARVKEIHRDFGNLSGFEKNVMRRVFPFYSWTRQNLPHQLAQLAEHPGGATAQALKAINRVHDNEGFTPEYINETLGIPLGEGEAGTKRYLTTLGLPFEDLKLLQTGRGSLTADAGRTIERLMGEMSPLIKAPLELATGKQFYSGRDLHDLYGPFGDVGLDQVIMNSPISRAYTTGRTLLDERKDALTKASNVLGPARVTDVDMEKAKDIAARQAVTDLLQQQPGVHTFERPYVRPEDVGMLSPEAVALLRLQTTLEKKAQARARESKKVGVRRAP